MAIKQLYKVKKVKATKSKSASKKAKKPVASKKAKGTPSKTKAKTSKPSKPAKKAVSKSVSKSSKSKLVKKAAKPSKSAKAPIKNKPAKPVAKKITPKVSAVKAKKAVASTKNSAAKAPKKIAKPAPAKPAKAAAPVKKTQPDKPLKAEKSTKPVKPDPQTAQKDKKQEKVRSKEKEPSHDFELDDLAEQPVKKKGKGGRKPKSKNDDDEPEIAHDELIEQIIQTTKKQSKQPKKPRILQTFVNPMASLSVALPADAGKKAAAPKKEPKGKFELEYVVRTSAGILYELLTTPSGLSEWFADDVNIRDGIFTFFWDGSEQKAKLIGFKEEKYVRLQWLDKPEGTYFEFRIERDELTGDISLMIVDFAEEGSDQLTSKLLWDSQVNKLLNVLGSN